ncbi:alpha-mannosidase 2C1-like isoform X2 [Portunus trituberculatus]|nr:alpha-mannosidase 2C1-like isoform X2 [Portunus trituberculatus]XP_045117161.1 alpha-mannosidase 2C1-like isoform X2 [Portunus trituberculatus]
MERDVTASQHKHWRTTQERVEKYISDNSFKDVNLRGKLYPKAKEVDRLYHWELPLGEKTWENWTFKSITIQDFKPIKTGMAFGPLWSTHWFKVEVNIPEDWIQQEVWLHWVSQGEAMLWSAKGEPLQGFSPGGVHLSPLKGAKRTGPLEPDQSRTDYMLSLCWSGSQETQIFYIEMACCGMFGAGADGMISPPDEDSVFQLEAVEVSTRDKLVYKLLTDIDVLHDMTVSLGSNDLRAHQALYAANHMINTIISGNYSQASQIADTFFGKRNGDLAHTVAMIGNCHIDSAWLWPYSETKRKCARSWSSTVLLLEEYPEMKFACSQAQQFSWVKLHYPKLYDKISLLVKAKRFIPVGGTWVEMDGLIPSGESFMRQFLYGQLFFKREFGALCKEFWLPDTFGYSAQFPQICKNFGITRFLTQKMSWSLFNKFPHHNFIWEGLDGSTILAHFPPGDSYELRVRVKEAVRTINNLQDKGRVSTSAFLYGHGDGGGGPTRNMLERSRRLRDVDGCPRMEHMSPSAFFERLETEQHNLCRWVGELYLELHNGTYTSQARTKKQNRICEFSLRNTEIFLAVVAVKGKMKKEELLRHQDKLHDAWEKVLLNQFHDVIPGTSIGLVYHDADRLYKEALASTEEVQRACRPFLFEDPGKKKNGEMVVINTLPWPMRQVMIVEEEGTQGEVQQSAGEGQYYVAVEAPGIGWSKLSTPLTPPKVTVSLTNNCYILENQYMKVQVNRFGQVESLMVAGESQDVFRREGTHAGQGNQLVLFDDVPLYWDAWDTMDYHLETGRVLNVKESGCEVNEVEVVQSGPLVVRLKWALKISEVSSITQEIELSAVSPYLVFRCKVDWHESHKFLKVLFNTALLARTAAFDSQFGFVERATHCNTSWDSAKFEVCGHKWADLSELSLGMAVLNDCKYGWTARGSTLMLSLLRSPKAPDAKCDMGQHTFSYALMPHKGCGDKTRVQRCAYEFNSNLALLSTSVSHDSEVWFSLAGSGAMIEAVKLAEDKSGDVVVRLYETLGGTTSARLKVPRQPQRVCLCNGLEEPMSDLSLEVGQDDEVFVDLTLSPFKIANIRITYN